MLQQRFHRDSPCGKVLLLLVSILCLYQTCRNIFGSFKYNMFPEIVMMENETKAFVLEKQSSEQQTNKTKQNNVTPTGTTTNTNNKKKKQQKPSKAKKTQPRIVRLADSKMIPFVHRHWESLAPKVQVSVIPIWLQDYIDFHNTAIANIRNKKKTIHDYNYLIFSCVQGTVIYCYGSGNRQQAIAAGFLNAVVTRRIFLIHDEIPVPLSGVLSPNLIQWDAFFPRASSSFNETNVRHDIDDDPTQRELPWTPVLRLDGNPYPLFTPSYFEHHKDTFIMRYVAGGPESIWYLMRSPEMTEYLQEQYNTSYHNSLDLVKKWVFNILFRPSALLQSHVNKAQQSLGIISEKKNVDKNGHGSFDFLPYVGVHVRMGNEGHKVLSRGDPDKEERYNISQIKPFYTSGEVYRRQILNETKMLEDGSTRPKSDVPIVIVADENEAKQELKKYDPLHIRYINSTVIHAGYFGLERLKAMAGTDVETGVIDTDNYNPDSLRAMLKNWTLENGSDSPVLASHRLSEEDSRQALMGLVTLWSDILFLAQSTCIVKSYSSFSVLAEDLSVDNKTGRRSCKCRQIEGLLFYNENFEHTCANLRSENK